MSTEYESGKRHWINVTNTPDGDGDYCARVVMDGTTVKTVYRKDRNEAIEAVRRWYDDAIKHDPNDVERIEL